MSKRIMFLSIGLFFISITLFVITYTISYQQKLNIQYHAIQSANDFSKQIADLGYVAAAYFLMEQDLITKTDASKFLSQSDNTLNEIDKRLLAIKKAILNKIEIEDIKNGY